MPTEERSPLLAKISNYTLVVSFSLILFAVVATLLIFLFSFLAKQVGFSDELSGISEAVRVVGLGIGTFLGMTGSLVIADKIVSNQFHKLEKSMNPYLLSSLSILLAIVLIGTFYFGFTTLVALIINTYWN